MPAQPQNDPPAFRILHGVANQIDEHLTQFSPSASKTEKTRLVCSKRKFETLYLCPQTHEVQNAVYKIRSSPAERFRSRYGRHRFGHVQHVVDQTKQMFAAAINNV